MTTSKDLKEGRTKIIWRIRKTKRRYHSFID